MLELVDKELLLRLSTKPQLLAFILKLTPDEQRDFAIVSKWSDGLVSLITNHPEIITELSRFTDTELGCLAQLTDWSDALLNHCARSDIIHALIAKLTEDELSCFKDVAAWTPAMTALAVSVDLFGALAKMTSNHRAAFFGCIGWTAALRSLCAEYKAINLLAKLTDNELMQLRSVMSWTPAMLSLVSSADAVGMLAKLTSAELQEFKRVTDWTPAMLSLVGSTGAVGMLAKLTSAELQEFKRVTDWTPALLTLTADTKFLNMLAKLTSIELSDLASVFDWTSTMLSITAKHDLMSLLHRCDHDQLNNLSAVTTYTDALITLLANQSTLQTLNKFTEQETEQFNVMLSWIGNAVQGKMPHLKTLLMDHRLIDSVLAKLAVDDMVLFKDIVSWPKPMLVLMAKDANILSFLQTLRPTELQSISQLMSWSPVLLVCLRDNPEHMNVLHRFWDIVPDREQFIKPYLNLVDAAVGTSVNVFDAFSRGQLSSKLWLINKTISLELKLGRTWTLCGWIGTLGWLMLREQRNLGIDCVRSFDVDPACANLADSLNRASVKDGWAFKASTLDVNSMQYDNFDYVTLKYDGTEQNVWESADTVINTSCDHMGSDDAWWDNIPQGKLVILQNNDWYENDQHNNSMQDIAAFKSKYPMGELLYEGELDLTLYTRFMLIGRK